MRILTTTQCYPTARHPDQGIFIQRRSLALAQLPDVSLRIVAPQPWCPVLRAPLAPTMPGPLPASYPKMTSVPVLSWACDALAFARTLETEIVTETIRNRRPDVIDAHFEYPDGVGACLAGRRQGIPVVVTLRGKIVSLSRKTVRRLQIAWMLRHADALIAVSGSLADWARRIGGNDLNVHVIPNAVDPAVFHQVDQTRARQALKWEPRAKYILAVGHQQYVKGFDRILEAIPAVRSACPDARFVLAGSDRGERRFRTRLASLVAEYNAAAGDPVIQLLPPAPPHTLNLMYNAADLMVNASRSEGWCNAIAESLACGTPVIATDVGGNREQIATSDVGTIVSKDATGLAAAITQALSKNWDRQIIAAKGSARTWDDTARQVYRVLASTLQTQDVALEPELAGALP